MLERRTQVKRQSCDSGRNGIRVIARAPVLVTQRCAGVGGVITRRELRAVAGAYDVSSSRCAAFPAIGDSAGP